MRIGATKKLKHPSLVRDMDCPHYTGPRGKAICDDCKAARQEAEAAGGRCVCKSKRPPITIDAALLAKPLEVCPCCLGVPPK